MDSTIRDATLHVSPVLRGGLTHQKGQLSSSCAVLAAKKTTTLARHVAQHSGMRLSITSKSLINIHEIEKVVRPGNVCSLQADF